MNHDDMQRADILRALEDVGRVFAYLEADHRQDIPGARLILDGIEDDADASRFLANLGGMVREAFTAGAAAGRRGTDPDENGPEYARWLAAYRAQLEGTAEEVQDRTD